MNRPRIVQIHGGKVHRDTCPTIRGLPQTPIDVLDSGALAREITFAGAQSCRHCKPITALAIYERQQRARPASASDLPERKERHR